MTDPAALAERLPSRADLADKFIRLTAFIECRKAMLHAPRTPQEAGALDELERLTEFMRLDSALRTRLSRRKR